MESVGEIKAADLQQIKEGGSHQIRNAVFSIPQTSIKPVNTDHISPIIKKKRKMYRVNKWMFGKDVAQVINPYFWSQSQWDMV